MPRPGYDYWVSYDGHGRLNDPKLNHDGKYVQHQGYVTDVMNDLAVAFLARKRSKPFSLFFAHKAVHPDAVQAADGAIDLAQQGGYRVAERHQNLYRGSVFRRTPNMLSHAEVLKQKPAWVEGVQAPGIGGEGRPPRAEAGEGRDPAARGHDGFRRRRRGQAARRTERQGKLDNTFIVFLSDNGYFFGEHGLGPERRFAYEEGIRSPFTVRFPPRVKAGRRVHDS